MKDVASARRFLVEALEQSNVSYFRDETGVAEAFVAGRTDVPIADLEMDSLAEMELCIAIEVNTGISIVPEELRDMEMLGELAKAVL